MCLHLLWLFTRYSISLTSVAEGLPSWTAALIICRLSCKQNSIDSAILGKLILAHLRTKNPGQRILWKWPFFTTKASKTASRSHKKRTKKIQKKKSARLAFWNVLSRLLAGCMFPWQFSGARFPPNIFVHDLFGAYRSEVMLFIYIIYSISFMHFSMLVSTRKFD